MVSSIVSVHNAGLKALSRQASFIYDPIQALLRASFACSVAQMRLDSNWPLGSFRSELAYPFLIGR